MKSFLSNNTLQCQKCGSTDLEVGFDLAEYGYFPIDISCNKCGYLTEVARIKKKGLYGDSSIIGTAVFSELGARDTSELELSFERVESSDCKMDKTDKYYKNENLQHMKFYEGAARMLKLKSRMNETLIEMLRTHTTTLKPALVQEVKDELEEADFLLKFCAEDWKGYWGLETLESQTEDLKVEFSLFHQD